ncbi:MAG: DMT family transporter [Clostridiales Family XIII bacterium]|jgi:drug/metabolite transporter (DMT)-like permease|nr:DMT family transporter [Clostridiales Family XIII bacterium]
MKKINWLSKPVNYVLMTILVIVWGYEYIAAKDAMETVAPLTLVCFKYGVALVFLIAYKLIRDRHFLLRKRDIGFFVLCALFGDIMYWVGEYNAMHYMQISLVTIVLAFVPVLSIILEIFIYKVKPTLAISLGIIICIAGVTLVVGADMKALLSGQFIGFLLAGVAVVSWNIYNFLTARLSGSYNPLDVTIYQLTAAVVVTLPYTVMNFPAVASIDAHFIYDVLYLALPSTCFSFVVYINSVRSIGVTPTALFSNMLPVTSTFFGWLCLGEMIAPLQIVGGAIVVAAGSVVIWLKGKERDGNNA